MKTFYALSFIGQWYRLQFAVPRRLQNKHSQHAWRRLEELETRVLLSATPAEIRDALDLPGDVAVTYTGDPEAVQARNLTTTGGLLGFPSGRDSDFLMLSTGIASQIDTVANTSGSQGTDLGAAGVDGDTATISFAINVPASAVTQKFKFDFMFLSEEYPEFVGSNFNDFFTATVNGTNVALDEFGNPISINNVFFTGAAATGTFFDGRTSQLTGSYTVPQGVSTLNVVLSVGDVGDGIYDSGVLLDNFRFEEPQVVYLDFGGGSISNVAGPATVLTQPAFTAADVNSTDTTANVVTQLVNGVKSLYSQYDISFVTTQPTSGDYMHVLIGGDDNSVVTMLNPLDSAKFNGLTTSISTYLSAPGLYGKGSSVDVGNLNRNDQASIFSKEFGTSYSSEDSATIIQRLTVTISHEVGHDLGLRHVTNANDGDIMKKNSPRSPTATFGNTELNLAEPASYTDGATTQNDNAYLDAVLGPSASGSSLAQSFNLNSLFQTYFINLPFLNLFDSTIGIIDLGGSSNDGTADDDSGSPLIVKTGDITGGVLEISVPSYLANPGFFLLGSSTKGGTPDIFSGTSSGGNLDEKNSVVPLLNSSGQLNPTINFASGAPGTLKSAGTATIFASQFTNVNFLPGNKGTFTDTDGDQYTVTLTGPGHVGVIQASSTTVGHAAIDQILMQGTDSTSNLTVAVKKKGGNGFVNIGSIQSTNGLGTISLKKSDIVGSGINVTGNLDQLLVHDIKAGADIKVTGTLGKLTARTEGTGTITAGKIGSIAIAGDKNATTVDFAANITTTGPKSDTSLASLNVKGEISGSNIVTVGSVGSVVVQNFVNSTLLVGFAPEVSAAPLSGGTFQSSVNLGSFTASGKSKTIPAYVGSSIVGTSIGKVTITSIVAGGNNQGIPFGVGYAIGQPAPSISIKSPAFHFAVGTSETLGDFHVDQL
jgi:predicted Zn-dependent protease